LGDTGEDGSAEEDLRFFGGPDRVVDCEEGKKSGRGRESVVPLRVGLTALRATRVVTVTEDTVDAPDFADFDGEKKSWSDDERDTEESIANRAQCYSHCLFTGHGHVTVT
jgi:hypothetical protein